MVLIFRFNHGTIPTPHMFALPISSVILPSFMPDQSLKMVLPSVPQQPKSMFLLLSTLVPEDFPMVSPDMIVTRESTSVSESKISLKVTVNL